MIAGRTNIVVVERHAPTREQWCATLRDVGAHVQAAAGPEELSALTEWRRADVVIAEATCPLGPPFGGAGGPPLLAVMGAVDQSLLSEIVRHQVLDVLLKPLPSAALVAAVRRALEASSARMPAVNDDETQAAEDQLLGDAAGAIARSDLPVLIVGETGTGKSRLARRLHDRLAPATPFIGVNASAISGALFCSEVFGHERGAFTGAAASKPGLVAKADGGTLFLDEIADLCREAQAHLLTFLDTGRYRPVGSVRERSADVRILAATNRDLEQQVRDGSFREDLYYRLAGFVIPIPPLRSRTRELAALARRLIHDAATRIGGCPPNLTDDAFAVLAEHDWPGNIRELRFVAERLAAGFPGATLDASAVEATIRRRRSRPVTGQQPVRPLAEVERDMVRRALRVADGNRTHAARLLGITPRGLYNKLRRDAAYFADVL